MLKRRKSKKFHRKNIKKAQVLDKFARLQRYEKIRNLYFNEKRSGARIAELALLAEHIDAVILQIRQIERRIRQYDLLSAPLRDLQIRLYYLHNRQKYDNDKALFKAVADFYNTDYIVAQQVIFSPDIHNAWYITETEGGKELI